MKTYKYDIRFSEDRLPMLVKECAVVYNTQIIHCNPEEIAEWYMYDYGAVSFVKEKVMLLAYDNQLKLIGIHELSSGTINASIVNPRDVFQIALALGAISIVLVHNHPANNIKPSSEDLNVMRRIKECGELLGIKLNDFIIVGNGCYFSAKQENELC